MLHRTKKQSWTVTHAFIHIGDLHLVLPALNLSTLDVDILMKMVQQVTSKIDDVLEHVGLPQVLPLTIHLKNLYGHIEGTILRHSYPFSFNLGHLLHDKQGLKYL